MHRWLTTYTGIRFCYHIVRAALKMGLSSLVVNLLPQSWIIFTLLALIGVVLFYRYTSSIPLHLGVVSLLSYKNCYINSVLHCLDYAMPHIKFWSDMESRGQLRCPWLEIMVSSPNWYNSPLATPWHYICTTWLINYLLSLPLFSTFCCYKTISVHL